MEPEKLAYQNSQIAWYRFGNGPVPVFCFHGYGESAQSFAFLEKHADKGFSFIAIDLPFHGATVWKEGLDLAPRDLLAIVEELAAGTEKFYLLGYSLGGRVALSLFECAPHRITKMVLLAPDGLKVNFWYWLATQVKIGRRIFRYTMKRPTWFFGLLKVFNTLGFVNASIFKFVRYYIGDANVRDLLYKRWISFRKLKPNLKNIRDHIRKNNTGVALLYGKHDRIILSSVGERFQKTIEKQCTVTVIDSGHQVLHEKYVTQILAALSGKNYTNFKH